MALQNLAVKLCGILQSQTEKEVTAREWRLVGQEQDGSQMFTWLSSGEGSAELLNVGVYTNKSKTLVTLHTFEEKLNIVQASVNATHSLLAYVVKKLPEDNPDLKDPLYCPSLISLLPDKKNVPEEVEESSTKQIFVQYVYGKSNKYSPGIRNDRFILFKHLQYIKIYRTPLFLNECDDGTDKWGFDGIYPEPETVVEVFSWSQWDCANQVLYYIHYRQPTHSFAEGEEVKSPCDITPTLSAFQFHADLPHETVLNIPLNLPHVPNSADGAACGAYEDDPVPLRIHDCSLDLQIVCDPSGMLCICHHYLYKPLDDSTTSLVLEDSADLKDSGVNFAYSITILHHGLVAHSVVPDLPWSKAKALRPSYTLYEEDYLLVNIPMLYTHLIDISLSHEPCCHVVIPSPDAPTCPPGGCAPESCPPGGSEQCPLGGCGTSESAPVAPARAPLLGFTPHAMLHLNTLDVVCVGVTQKELTAAFKSTGVGNKLAILHYLILHQGSHDLAGELVSWMCLQQGPGLLSLQQVLQQYLVGSAYSWTRRGLPSHAASLAAMLPLSVHTADVHANVTVSPDTTVSLTQEKLWNSSAVVLAPRQRVCQFSVDVWTRLWATLGGHKPHRLSARIVRDSLAHSLTCYQPEALSRCSTPLSPGAAPLPASRRPSLAAQDLLPFLELDVCTASRQEHVVAANIRAVSVHLMRECSSIGANKVESGVHACAARWAAAQGDASRELCRLLARAVAATPANSHQRGLGFVDELDPTHAYILFKLFEQYYLATDSIAFPLPQGFSSFFTYLGYRTLPFYSFIQYVHRNVFELQIDVLKAIVGTKDDSETSVRNKLRLIQLVGGSRARRVLCSFPHKSAVVLRARDHAQTLLSGAQQRPATSHTHAGVTVLPSGDHLSPLDTFLDLLTAKASLNELDFNLIIEATMISLQQPKAA